MGERPPVPEGLLTQLGVKDGSEGPLAAAEGKIVPGGPGTPERLLAGVSGMGPAR
jgi:hypothetical protein